MSVLSKIQALTKQLFPSGRAFKMPKDSYFEKLMYALAESEKRAYDDAVAILDSILPDNSDFTAADATQWERRLGIIREDGVSLADRKLAIQRKYNHPGEQKARHHYLFLQKQLRDAGFDVYVHENRFAYGDGSYYTLPPTAFDPNFPIASNQHSNQIQHGQIQHGGTYGNKVVNVIDQSLDNTFNVGATLRKTFFIGGPYIGDYATVPEVRKEEFRQLILMSKPVECCGFLFVVYSY